MRWFLGLASITVVKNVLDRKGTASWTSLPMYNSQLHCILRILLCYFSDENECVTQPGVCSQTCTNLPGSYQCGCNTGYILAADLKTCQG